MTRNRFELPHAVGTEALAQRVDQRRGFFNIVTLNGRMHRRDIELALPRWHRFDACRRKADSLETEAAVVQGRERLELEIDQSRHMRHAARRRRQADIDDFDRPIDPIEAQSQRARSDVVADKYMPKVVHETAGAGEDRLLADDRL